MEFINIYKVHLNVDIWLLFVINIYAGYELILLLFEVSRVSKSAINLNFGGILLSCNMVAGFFNVSPRRQLHRLDHHVSRYIASILFAIDELLVF